LVKRLTIYTFRYECIKSFELFFNQLISLKSSEINRLYEQINMLNSLKAKLYKLRDDFEFLSMKNNHSSLENSLSLSLF